MRQSVLYIFLMFFLIGCNKPKVYECTPGTKRFCLCLDGTLGEQECSKGPLYTNWKARKWIPCSCCWRTLSDDQGPYRTEKVDASGCWTDTYNPATPTYDIGDSDNEGGGPSEGEM